MLICLDAGHGKHTGGRRCMKQFDPAETREWELNRRVADHLTPMLEQYGVSVIRADDVTGENDVPMADRCATANRAGADAYISIHHNAGIRGGKGGGIVVFIAPSHQKQSEILQESIYRHTVSRTGLKGNRSNPKPEGNLYVLRNTRMPAVLIECGFMDSKVDTPIIITEEHSRKVAQGICDALVEVYALTKDEPYTPGQKVDGCLDTAIPVERFAIELVDNGKLDCGGEYANAGFFANFKERGELFTLPAGHVVCDYKATSVHTNFYCRERGTFKGNKFTFDSGSFSNRDMNPFYGKEVSALVIKDDKATVGEYEHIPECDYAIAGVPVIRKGRPVEAAVARSMGFGTDTLRATQHIMVGLRTGENTVHVLGIKTKSGNLLESGEVYALLSRQGFTDVLNLDGGGSYIYRLDGVNDKAPGNRRICTIIREKESAEKKEPMEPVPEIDPSYEEWLKNLEKYRKENGL